MNLSTVLRGNAPVSEFLPRYGELVEAGIVYGVTYTAAAIATPSATATGSFALFNPATSGVQLVILKATVPVITFTAGTTGAAFGFQLVPNQTPSATTPGNTPQNMLVGSANVAKATSFTAGTLVGAPTAAAYWIDSAYLDLAAGDISMKQSEIEGDVTVNPNSGVCIVMSGTLTATVAPSLVWAEVPMG